MPPNQRRRLLAAIGLAATGGCLRLSTTEGQGNEGESRARTATQVVTQQATATGKKPEYPIGVSSDGVTVSVLLAHARVLANTSATLTITRQFGDSTSAQIRRIGSEGQLLFQGERGSGTLYLSADGELYGKYKDLYIYRKGVDWTQERKFRRPELKKMVKTGDYVPTGTTTVNGQTYFELTAEKKKSDALAKNYPGSATVEWGQGEGRLRPDGLIQRLSATYTLVHSGRRKARSLVRELTDVGSTSVSPPDWTATAKERAPRFSAAFTDDSRQFVKITHTGGDGITERLRVNVFSEEGQLGFLEGSLDGGLPAGETLFVSRSGSGGLSLSVGSKPDTDPPPFPSPITIYLEVGPLTIYRTELSA